MLHKRIKLLLLAAALLALALCFAVPGLADVPKLTATINSKKTETTVVTTELASITEIGGSITIPIWLTATEAETIAQVMPDTSAVVLYNKKQYNNQILQNAEFVMADGTEDIALGTSEMVFVYCDILPTANKGIYENVVLNLFTADSEPLQICFNLVKTSPSTNPTPTPAQPVPTPHREDEDVKALTLAPTGADGAVVPAPAGDAGDTVMLRLPIKCRKDVITGAQITPVLSGDLNEFPFVIEAVDYTRTIPTLGPNSIAELQYNMKISPDATSGVKTVSFNAVYYRNNVLETSSFKVYVNVLKGKEEALKDKDGNLITSMPKLIVESYSVAPKSPKEGDPKDRLFAGEPFILRFTVRNTSSRETVKNIQITVSNAANAILPASGGSNSLYIQSIGKGESVDCKLELQSVPDAEAKPQNLSIAFDYEGAEVQKSYSIKQDLTLAVSQRMRVKVDDPTVYGEGIMPGSTAGISFGVYNQGKGTIYNCMVNVEGKGLRMEESLSGGNISAGSSMRADFNIIADEPGEIKGNIIVTYEDVYGVETRVEKPITLNVEEEQSGMEFVDPMAEEMMNPGAKQGGFPWLWVAIGAAVIALAVVLLLVRRKKRRSRELEDV